jgi:cell shape-determining protein MreC
MIGLALAGGLMLLPHRWSAAVQGELLAWLRPGQLAVLSLREHGGRLLAQATAHFDTVDRLAEAERECRRLAERNRRLEAELVLATSQSTHPAPTTGDPGVDQLLKARCVEARILGHLGRQFLGRHHLLDVGSESGIQADAPVLQPTPQLIDRGDDAGLKPGQPVISQGRVCGKVVRVGRHTSLVQTLTEPGYRDLVRLGPSGPEGVLEGTGEPLVRIRLVEVTEPVSVGDVVLSTAGQGVAAEPFVYGRVVRVERSVGAAHWDIWMQPAVQPTPADRLAVVRIELNPSRVGSREWGVEREDWMSGACQLRSTLP